MLRRQLLLMSGLATTLSTSTLLTACGSDTATTKDIFEVVRNDANLSVLADAIISAGLVQTFQTNTSYTLFAPNNAAFVAALAELGLTKEQLFANKALLKNILTYHLLPGKVNFADIPLNTALKTVQGATLKIDNIAGTLTITDGRSRKSQIIQNNIDARNGVVHVVDKVLLPPV